MAANGFDDDQTRSFTNLAAGTIISHYKIISKIGAGGMGEVYLAEDTQLDRKVALKFLPPHLSQDEAARARFTREAKAAAKLDHPNIVQVFEVGEFQGRPFFAMAHIEGKSLRDVIREGKLSIDEAIEYTKQICEGLNDAHNAGVIHRDIKPGNIIIDSKGKARILDFGLAAVSGEDKLTKTGSTLGTVGYMSPEQIEGRQADHRSDLFSVGVMLYEMITGRRPFGGDNDVAVARSITDTTPEPIARYKSGTTRELQQIVDKALSKDPSLRYQGATDIICDLKAVARDQQSHSKKDVLRPSIAVLPFTNLSPDPEQEYFCDGMAEEIINALTHIEGLRVVARTSCFTFKGKNLDIREIGRKLNVANVLEGSVRKVGNRIRITSQLVKISDGYHLWSERYERELSDIFEVQDEISIAIVEKLKVKLLGREHEQIVKRPTNNLEAYNLYLKGCYHLNNGGLKEVQKAIKCLEGAVKLDPGFSLGHAGLSNAYIIQSNNYSISDMRTTFMTMAERSVFKALETDNSLAEAHSSLAKIRASQWKWDEAEREFLLAIRLNPRYAAAHHGYSLLLAAKGKFVQSWEHLKLARELDPLSLILVASQAIICYLRRQYDKAIEICREGLDLSPDFPLYSRIIGWSLMEKGDYTEAIKLFNRNIEFSKKELPGGFDPAFSTLCIGRTYAMMGEYDKAKKILEDTIERVKDQPALFNLVATLCFAVGDIDRGFEWLERFVREQAWQPMFRFSPFYDSVRHDPRFLSIMRKIGFDQDVQSIQNN